MPASRGDRRPGSGASGKPSTALPRFTYLQDLPGPDILQPLALAARPRDLDRVDLRRLAQPEVKPSVTLEKIRRRTAGLGADRAPSGLQRHLGPEPVPVGLRPLEIERDPRVARSVPVPEQDRTVRDVGGEDIHPPVVVEVEDRGAPPPELRPEEGSALLRGVLEDPRPVVLEQERLPPVQIVQVPVHDHDVQISIVVEVDEAAAPRRVLRLDPPDSRRHDRVVEEALGRPQVERTVADARDENVRHAVCVHVPGPGAPRAGAAAAAITPWSGRSRAAFSVTSSKGPGARLGWCWFGRRGMPSGAGEMTAWG